MTNNPLYNALAALGYIVLIVTGIFYGGPLIGPEDTIFIPMAMLSLFVLSASIMGYIFLYQPAVLFLDNKRQEATTLFLSTVGIFACLTLALFILQLLLS